MDSKLLDYYNRELAYLREMGAEFAEQYPKVAGRLGMRGIDVADPYIERLMEGFAFLTSRVQLKMDAEFPRFSQRLLEIIYPNYLSPTPSMAIAELQPDSSKGDISNGFVVPRGTMMDSQTLKKSGITCSYTTAHDVTLQPVRIAGVELGGIPADIPLASLGLQHSGCVSALRIRLECYESVTLNNLQLDQLMFYGRAGHAGAAVAGTADAAQRRACLPNGGAAAAAARAGAGWAAAGGLRRRSGAAAQRPAQLRRLPAAAGYFAFRRASSSSASTACARCCRACAKGKSAAPVRDRGAAGSARRRAGTGGRRRPFGAALHAGDQPVSEGRRTHRNQRKNHEYHLVVDNIRPLDYEVFSVQRLGGSASEKRYEQEFRPFYSTLSADDGNYGAYFSLRREQRTLSEHARRYGTRTGYAGSEVFVSLVDERQSPWHSDLKYLTADVLCTSRDLPLMLLQQDQGNFVMPDSIPIKQVSLRKAHPPRPALAEGMITGG